MTTHDELVVALAGRFTRRITRRVTRDAGARPAYQRHIEPGLCETWGRRFAPSYPTPPIRNTTYDPNKNR